MINRLAQILFSFELTWQSALWAGSIFLVTLVGSLIVVSFVLVKLPPTYFQSSHAREFWTDRHPAVRWSGIIVKNIVGFLIVCLGVLMSLPGVPGQGILTILLGIMLLDFPGKRRLELKILSRPKVLRAINNLRNRFNRPPLVLD